MRRRRLGAGSLVTARPSISTVPASGVTSRLMVLTSVLLPEPDSPTTATKPPSGDLQVDPVQGMVAPAVERLAQARQADHGLGLIAPDRSRGTG